MHVLYEMHHLHRVRIVTRFHATNPWEPGYREHPTIHRMTHSHHFLLHRRLNELLELERCRGTVSLSLRWHHFVIVAVAPL